MRIIKVIFSVVSVPFDVIVGITAGLIYVFLVSEEDRIFNRRVENVALLAHTNSVAAGVLAEHYLNKMEEERKAK